MEILILGGGGSVWGLGTYVCDVNIRKGFP